MKEKFELYTRGYFREELENGQVHLSKPEQAPLSDLVESKTLSNWGDGLRGLRVPVDTSYAPLLSESKVSSSAARAADAPVSSSFPGYDLRKLEANVREIMMFAQECIENPEFEIGPDMTAAARDLRSIFIRKVGWSIPSIKITDLIVQHVKKDRVLSLAAGKAAQETCLAAKGVQIVCADRDPPRDSWMPVERLSNDEAVAIYRSQCDIAMIVWPSFIPSYREPIPDCHTYLALLAGNFKKIIYIGCEHSCTGSEQLERFLDINYETLVDDNDEDAHGPTWQGIHDFLRVFVRKTPKVVEVSKSEN